MDREAEGHFYIPTSLSTLVLTCKVNGMKQLCLLLFILTGSKD